MVPKYASLCLFFYKSAGERCPRCGGADVRHTGRESIHRGGECVLHGRGERGTSVVRTVCTHAVFFFVGFPREKGFFHLYLYLLVCQSEFVAQGKKNRLGGGKNLSNRRVFCEAEFLPCIGHWSVYSGVYPYSGCRQMSKLTR